ncbi:MAG: MFS transporter [Hyphomicrobiales bacterium]|nr:MFS transporter [Hyphomicrobiales bacterium]
MSSSSAVGDGEVARSRPSNGLVVATVAGNALEFYDFISYIFFTPAIAAAFFPQGDKLAGLLSALAVFGVGFFFRPVGGLIIGRYADRAGRRPAMILTISLITLGTLGIVLTPGYKSIGLLAPVLVVFWRCVQGFAIGGDVGPATAYLVEIAPDKQRGLFGSWQIASQGVASIITGIVAIVLTMALGPATMAAWGWRLVFLVGLALVPVALYLRSNMPETLGTGGAHGIKAASLTDDPMLLLKALLLVMGGTVATYVATFMPIYAVTVLHYPPTIIFPDVVVLGLSVMIGGLVGGALSDRFGRRTMMILPYMLLWLTVYYVVYRVNTVHQLWVVFAGTAWIGALVSMSAGASLTLVPEIIPARIRAFGMSLIYSLGVAVFGGTTPFVVQFLAGVTHNSMIAPIYVMVIGALAMLAMFMMPERSGQPIDRG